MPAHMHPDLAALEARYDQLIDSYQAGSLSYDDALSTLRSLSAIDGDGSVWTIDEQGNFLRARPGQPPVVTDPLHFAPATPANAPRPAPPWMAQPSASPEFGQPDPARPGTVDDLMSPPSSFDDPGHPVSQPFAPVPPPGTPMPGQPMHGAPMPNFGPDPAGPQRSIADAEEEPGLIAKLLPKGVAAKVEPLLAKHGRTLLVALVALVAVAFFVGRGGSDTPPEDPSGLPTQSTTLDELPGSGDTIPGDGTTDTTAPAAAAFPSTAETDAVVAALTSGDRAAVDAAIAAELSPKDLALQAAYFTGFGHAGLTVTSGPAAEAGDGTATSTITVTDAATEEPLKTFTATWQRTGDGKWILAAAPAA